MRIVRLEVKGIPVAWSRPRPGNGGYYSPHLATPWYKTILLSAKLARPRPALAGPLVLVATFLLPRPKGRKSETWHAVRPDIDNLIKLLLDALGPDDAGWFYNDWQVSRVEAEKRYVAPGESPGVLFVFRELEEQGHAG